MAELHVLRVFTDETGNHGNLLGVFLDGPGVPEADRQGIAADLGFAETVYVDEAATGRIRIFTPETELGFAGHPSVGTAWLLRRAGESPDVLRPPAGEVAVRIEGEETYVAARPEWCPEFELVERSSPEEVNGLEPGEGSGRDYNWAWEDQGSGRVRARAMLPDYGIAEDEATGSAAIRLTALLDRPLEIRQGGGSVIRTRPVGGGFAEAGGRVVLDERREYELPSP